MHPTKPNPISNAFILQKQQPSEASQPDGRYYPVRLRGLFKCLWSIPAKHSLLREKTLKLCTCFMRPILTLRINLNKLLCSQNAFLLLPPACKGTSIRSSLKSRRQKENHKPAVMVSHDPGSGHGTNMDRAWLPTARLSQQGTLSSLDTDTWDTVGKRW